MSASLFRRQKKHSTTLNVWKSSAGSRSAPFECARVFYFDILAFYFSAGETYAAAFSIRTIFDLLPALMHFGSIPSSILLMSLRGRNGRGMRLGATLQSWGSRAYEYGRYRKMGHGSWICDMGHGICDMGPSEGQHRGANSMGKRRMLVRVIIFLVTWVLGESEEDAVEADWGV